MNMSGLSAYELERLENIKRNHKVLQDLGLVASDAELHATLRGDKPAAKKKQKREVSGPEAAREAVRRSHRLAGRPPELGGEPGGSGGCRSSAQPTAAPSDPDHEDARAEYDLWAARWMGKQQGETIVGTASYGPLLTRTSCAVASLPRGPMQGLPVAGHTLMRVRTMSDVGLANRIRAIERACGAAPDPNHAVCRIAASCWRGANRPARRRQDEALRDGPRARGVRRAHNNRKVLGLAGCAV